MNLLYIKMVNFIIQQIINKKSQYIMNNKFNNSKKIFNYQEVIGLKKQEIII